MGRKAQRAAKDDFWFLNGGAGRRMVSTEVEATFGVVEVGWIFGERLEARMDDG